MLPIKVWLIWQLGFRGENFEKSKNQKQELPVVAMFVYESGRSEHSLYRIFHRCFLPSVGSFCTSVFQGRRFLEINQSETWIACGGHAC